MAGTIRVRGVFELTNALGRIDASVKKDMRKELAKVAEPVRSGSESNARGHPSGLVGPPWTGMRVGVTAKSVYVAPKARRSGGSPRKNLGPFLQHAMDDALEQHTEEIVIGLDHWLGELGVEAGF